MTVKELIEILQTMPQEAEVTRLNTEEDRFFTEHFDDVCRVEKVEEWEVRIL